MDDMIRSEDLSYTYTDEEESTATTDPIYALNNVTLDVQKGQFIVILGHNGSGKSTFAKIINALLIPSGGTIWVNGIDTKDEEHLWDVRQSAGMIFQNPDNQMIASIVEEDVAFGPENLGVEPAEIRRRVDKALKAVDMSEYAKASPTHMSGGQKQRIAIAGILAMKPQCLVLDEPTAMLDPRGREEVMQTLTRLNRQEGITIIHITHYMEEAVLADRLFVMDAGRVVLSGTPKQVFRQTEKMKSLGLDVPPVTMLAHRLRKDGLDVPDDILTVDEMTEALCRLKSKM